MPVAEAYTGPRLDLGMALEEYPIAGAEGFIADQILPVTPVAKKAASFSVITRESILRDANVVRSVGSAFGRGTFGTDEVSYRCEGYGIEQKLPDELAEFYSSDFDAAMTAAAVAAATVKRERERRVAAIIQNTSTWTGAALYTDLGTDWDSASSTPIADVDATKEIIRRNCGLSPNTMVISAAVIPWLKYNTDLGNRLRYVMALTNEVIRQSLAELFGIPNVLIAGAVRNSGAEGESFSGSDIWSDNYCWLGVVPQTPNIAEPGVGRTLLWQADTPSIMTVSEYYEVQTKSRIFRAEQHLQEKVIDAYYGHLLLIDT